MVGESPPTQVARGHAPPSAEACWAAGSFFLPLKRQGVTDSPSEYAYPSGVATGHTSSASPAANSPIRTRMGSREPTHASNAGDDVDNRLLPI